MASRRRFVGSSAAAASLALAGCLGGLGGDSEVPEPPEDDGTGSTDKETVTWDGESQLESFVDTDGSDFVIDGESVYFNGTNNFGLGISGAGTIAKIDDRVPLYDELGFNLLRTWAFGEGEGLKQPKPGKYNEKAFQPLDYLVAKASEHGIRLVLPLVDYWTYYGGMRRYESWSSTLDVEFETNRLKPAGQFYRDDQAQKLYREYIEHVLTRENQFTGRQYNEEPAIAIWELANEPRLRRSSVENNGAVFQQWVNDTASLISELTDDQLVSTGMEGFWAREDGSGFWEDGTEGTAFVQNHSIDAIDACSIHMYPQAWGQSVEWSLDWIEDHARDAHEEIGKPLYVGEFGWKASRVENWEQKRKRRQKTLRNWYSALDEHDVNGALYWQVNSAKSSPGEHTVTPEDKSFEIVDKYTQTVKRKSGVEW